MSFISDLFNGLIKDPLEQINEYIDKWHNGEGGKVKLPKFLGLTNDQYKAYCSNPKKFFESPLLVKVNDNWADEMDVRGFAIMDLKSLYEFYKGLEDYFRTNPDGTLSYSIGTNEYIEHDSIKSIIYCLDISFITVDQAEAIKQTIGLAYGEASLLDILDYV